MSKVDFRTVKSVVDNSISKLNTQDKNWKWKAVVNKGTVKIKWGYIESVGGFTDSDNCFTIREIEGSTVEEPFINASDPLNNNINSMMVGTEKSYQDGTLEKCVANLIDSIYSFASSRY